MRHTHCLCASLILTLLNACATVPPPQKAPGANMPFVTHEAEAPDNISNGKYVTLEGLPELEAHSPEIEASGRAFVELNKTGNYLEFPNVAAADTLVIRHCIPDAPEGGGQTATLGLYVNGERRQDLKLTSKYNWLYSDGKKQNGQSNTPTAHPHVFWDESRYWIEGGLKKGDSLRLQKDDVDQAAYYRIDLIDLEMAPPPLPRPENSLSILDYGANGLDLGDDTAAVKNCIAEAKAEGKTVWIPAGTYRQREIFLLEGVRVQGAGMWYTSLIQSVPGTDWTGNGGFKITGTGSSVSDLYIDSEVCTSRGTGGSKPLVGRGDQWSIRNVWITHSNVGAWMSGTNGVIRNCRVRMTYADGININNGGNSYTDGVLVENNHVRGSGDDGIAVLSESRYKDYTRNVTVRFNTIIAPWWASNLDLAGGQGHRIEDNYIADSGQHPGLIINMPTAYAMTSLEDSKLTRNTVLRCGGNHSGQKLGAVWIYSGTDEIRNALFEDNHIEDSIFRAVHIQGPKPQDIAFINNTFKDPGENVIYVMHNAQGTARFINNIATGIQAGTPVILNRSEGKYSITESGNSWQAGDPLN